MLPFAEIAFNRFLGLDLRRSIAGEAEIALAPRAEFLQEIGVIHGGVITSLADTTAVYSLTPTLSDSERMTGIELKINFLAAATLDGGELVARSRVVRRGRTIAVAEVDVEQGGRAVAKALFTFLIAAR